jgi:hypothetical protein
LQRILLVLWVKPGDDLARREHIAHVDGALDHPSVEAKGEVDLVLGANLPCQRNGLAFKGALDGGCPDGSCSGRGWVGWLQPATVAEINATAKIRGVNIGIAFFPGDNRGIALLSALYYLVLRSAVY